MDCMNAQDMHLCTPQEHRLSRRRWLGGTAGLGLAAMFSPAVAAQLEKKQKQVLFIWLDGGISQLESWDPKSGTQFGGPFRAIGTSLPGVHISELLPRTARHMHQLAVIRSLHTQYEDHSSGVAHIQRGDPKNRGVVYPFLGSAVARLMGPGESGLPAYISVKPGGGGFITGDAGFLGPQYGAVALGDGKAPDNLPRPASLTAADDDARNELRMRMNRRYAAGRRSEVSQANEHVFEMAAQLKKRLDLFDPASLPPSDIDRYGTHDLGRPLLVARRMLEAGVRFVKVTSYGWDTHGDNFNGHLSLVPKFDQAFAAVIDDLAQRGMLDHVLVIAMSEFGRTPRINGHLGRDHWPEAWSLVMAGCGIQRGIVVGKTNDQGTFVDSEEHDIGHLFHTWFQALGVDSTSVEYDNQGQPLPIAHEGCHAIKELLV
jgi:uncharacterized protein (DUF1501 family)